MIRCEQLQWGPKGQPLTPPLDLYLPAGSVTAVGGRNGCGKSSLFEVLAGWRQPLRGRLRIDAPRLGGIAYLPQQQAVDRHFPITLQELVAGGLWRWRLSGEARRQRVEQVLAFWQLEGVAQQPLQSLSGGQLQRGLLARLALTDARLLLLDEAEAALDSEGLLLFWQQLAQWREAGRTVMLISHALEPLSQRVDSLLLVAAGGCIQAPLNIARLGRVA